MKKYQRNDYAPDDYVNIGLRGRGLLANAIADAAEKMRSSSMADYMRRVLEEAAARDLGVPLASVQYDRRTGITPDLDKVEAALRALAEAQAKREALVAEEAEAKRNLERLQSGLGVSRSTRRR